MLLESKRVYVLRQWAEENRSVSRTWDVLGKLVEKHDGDDGQNGVRKFEQHGYHPPNMPQASRAKSRVRVMCHNLLFLRPNNHRRVHVRGLPHGVTSVTTHVHDAVRDTVGR